MRVYKVLKWVNALITTGPAPDRRRLASDARYEAVRGAIARDFVGEEWKPFGGLNWSYGNTVRETFNKHTKPKALKKLRSEYPGISQRFPDGDQFVAEVMRDVLIPQMAIQFEKSNLTAPFNLLRSAIPAMYVLGWKRFLVLVLTGIIGQETYVPLVGPDKNVCGDSILLYTMYAAVLVPGLLLWPTRYLDFIPFFGQGVAMYELVSSHVIDPPVWATGAELPSKNPINYIDGTSVVHSGHYYGLLLGFLSIYLTRNIS